MANLDQPREVFRGLRRFHSARVRELLADQPRVVEKPIVGGGLGFMVGGHLSCAVSSRGLTVRVGPSEKVRMLEEPHVRPHRVGTDEVWDVVRPDRRYLGSVAMPTGFRLHAADEQAVVGVWTDDFDVEHLRRYSLETR